MNVSVVILNWNGEKYLNEFLPILLNNLDNVPDAEIVVADNGSTDGSLQLLAEKLIINVISSVPLLNVNTSPLS